MTHKKDKQVMITMDDFIKYPLSQAIQLAVKDVADAVERNFKINMDLFFDSNSRNTKCSVCFAGAVLTSFYPEQTIKQLDLIIPDVIYGGPFRSKTVNTIAHTFDSLRRGEVYYAACMWLGAKKANSKIKKLQNLEFVKSYRGICSGNKLENFKTRMLYISSELEKIGL